MREGRGSSDKAAGAKSHAAFEKTSTGDPHKKPPICFVFVNPVRAGHVTHSRDQFFQIQ